MALHSRAWPRVISPLQAFFYQMGIPPARMDVLMSVDGLRFEEAWPNGQEAPLGGVRAWFIGRQDLIRNKKAVGRHIDMHDAELLE